MRDMTQDRTLDELRGLEGDAARHYFDVFDELIVAQKDSFKFADRNRRPPTDMVNAVLSYVYSLLAHDTASALEGTGLDPAVGYLHRDRPGRPSLALDLMEEFRAPIADSVVQTVVNNGEVKPSGFTEVLGSVRMNDRTRKSLISAFERRMETQIVHPIFGYKASWRRVVEIQARMILGYLDGTQSEYHGMRIR